MGHGGVDICTSYTTVVQAEWDIHRGQEVAQTALVCIDTIAMVLLVYGKSLKLPFLPIMQPVLAEQVASYPGLAEQAALLHTPEPYMCLC